MNESAERMNCGEGVMDCEFAKYFTYLPLLYLNKYPPLNPLSHLFEDDHTGYQRLFEGVPDPVFVLDANEKLLFVNDAWTTVLGYSLEDVQERSLVSFVTETDQEIFAGYMARLSSEGAGPHKVTVRFKTAYNTLILMEGFLSAGLTHRSLPLLTGFFRDITQSFEAEATAKHLYEELTRREYDLQQLLEFAPDAVIVIDQQGLIRFWNSKSTSLFGWLSDDVIGKPLSQCIIPVQYRAAHEAGMKRFLATGEAHVLNQTIEITALRKTGEEFDVSLTISTTRQGDDIAFIAFIRDITFQKTNSRELDRHRIALEDSNRELEQFAHVASHDMKEPIRKISLFVDRMRKDYEEGKTSLNLNHLHKIGKSALRLHTMVEGVLKYSSLSGHKADFEWIDTNEIVQHIKDDLEQMIKETGARIHCDQLPGFEGISFLIHQLFYNLVSNSLKFSRENITPVIEISGRVYTHPNVSQILVGENVIPNVEISIKDNGIGFNAAYGETIFQTFTRLHSKDTYEGTGLGLALCKRIIMRHHGEIRAEGVEGDGARFTMILPQRQP